LKVQPVKHIDGPTKKIASCLKEPILFNATRYMQQEIQPVIDQIAFENNCNEKELSAIESTEILEKCINSVTDALKKFADGYTPMRWLWMLRRLPDDIFKGSLTTTSTYDTLLAEVLSGQSQCQRNEVKQRKGAIYYQLDDCVIRRLARFCVGVSFLSDLHRSYRWAAKGTTFLFRKGYPPKKDIPKDIERAVQAYDRRSEKFGRPLNRTGTVLTSGDLSSQSNSILWLQRIKPKDMPVLRPGIRINDATEKDYALQTCRFVPYSLPLNSFIKLLNDRRVQTQQVVNREAAVLIFLLVSSYILMTHHHAGFLTPLTRGYLLWPKKDDAFQTIEEIFLELPELLTQLLSCAAIHNNRELLDAACGMQGSTWPLTAGPVCREFDNGICLDLAAASMRLDAILKYPSTQGEIANARSEHFETEVQSVIDRSDWFPSSEIKKIRGRQLKNNGNVITDIDAIGEKDESLLLVDCKSVIYSGDYDIGDYKTVRNASSLVRESVKKWKDICNRLHSNPIGNNYNISKYKNLFGVVCTPHVIYSDIETMSAQILPGLPMACSIIELSQWLLKDK
jgi:hypothetical protein